MSGRLFIKNARILTEGGFVEGALSAVDGLIFEIGNAAIPSGALVVDAEGAILVPGFIELHTHGAYGVDVNSADAEGLRRLGCFFAANGVTGWLCSILTDTEQQTLKAIAAAREAMADSGGGAFLLGIHLEGPFLSEAYAGAMPKSLLRRGDLALFERYQEAAGGAIRYITVSPEVPGVIGLVRAISRDTLVGIGHSGATYDEAMACIEAGARLVTHTFNAMRLFHQHEPAIMGAALENDDVCCEAICDGLHLHPGAVRLLLRAKGTSRVVAVTDSIMASGLPDGEYMLGVNEVCVRHGDAWLKHGNARAGSTLTAAAALRNLHSFTGRPLDELMALMSANPARLIGESGRMGRIAPGYEANLVLLDDDLHFRRAFLRAELAQA